MSGIKSAASKETKVTYSKDGTGAEGATVIRRRVSRAVVLAGALAGALGAVAGGAWGDPPGYPSTGSAAAPKAGSGSATPSLDDVARARIAALKKFARDKEGDPTFAAHEGAARACRIDHDKRLVTLTFNADGTVHCKLAELAEGYQLEIWILTVKDVYSTGGHYRVTVTPGAPLKAAPIRGTSSHRVTGRTTL